MTHHLLRTIAIWGLCLFATACTDDTQEELDDTAVVLEQESDNELDSNDSGSENDTVHDNGTTLTQAELRSPVAGAIINHRTITIAPSHNDAPLWLDVGTTENGEDLFNGSIEGPIQLSDVPLNGRPIFISLWTDINGDWRVHKYRFETLNNVTDSDLDSDDNTSRSDEMTQDVVNYGFKALDANYIVQSGKQLQGQLQSIDLQDSHLQFEITAQPKHGSVQLNSDTGFFTYQAGNQLPGENDAFAYRVFDGKHVSPPAMVRFTYSEHAAITLQGRTDGVGADLVIVAEGFTENDLPFFHHSVDKYIEFMFNYEPEFQHQKKAWNIHRIDLISQQNGSDLNYGSDTRNTALDSGFNCRDIQRLLCVNPSKTFAVVNSVFPQWDNILVIVNSSTYGGAGYSSGIGTVSMANSAMDVALHEMAHSFAGLGDEYTYGKSNAPTQEPSASNLTINNNEQDVKWAHWIGIDPEVGLFEGGQYVAAGVWRPTDNSFMRSLGAPFHSVNKEAWTLAVYERGGVVLNQLPSQAKVMQALGETTQFYIDTLFDIQALDIQWYLNDQVQTELHNRPKVSLGADQSSNFEVSVKISDGSGIVIKDPQNHSSEEIRWFVSVQ